MAPAVLHIPYEVRRDWIENVKSRYVRQLITETPTALLWALRNPGVLRVSDVRLAVLLCDGIVGRFLTPVVDDADQVLFASVAAANPLKEGERYYKADYRIMGLVAPDAESNAAPTVALFRRSEAGQYSILAIAVADEVWRPSDGSCWERAKYFALQSAGVATTLHMHPRLHFPTDAIDAVARTLLPDGHALKELLRPHLRLELSVSDAVLHGDRSVLRPGHVYSPYPGTLEENLRLVGTIWKGYPHGDGSPNTAYPAYRFPMRPAEVHAPYGDFLNRYFEAIFRFVSSVVAETTADDDIRDFAHHVSTWIPGFPDGQAVGDPEVLSSALASVIFNVSVAHSADHFLYGQVDPREMPFRIKLDRPIRGVDVPLNHTTVVDTKDLVAARMCSRMYFQPHVLERLVDAEYRFDDPAHSRAVVAFRADLESTERRIVADGLRNYVPLEHIATSVQF